MTKTKVALLIIAAGVVLVIAAVLLLLFSAPKENPWQLTYAIVPGEVVSAYIWSTDLNSVIRYLTDEEIVQAVHLINQLDESAFTVTYGNSALSGDYSLHIISNRIELKMSWAGESKTILAFDEETAEALDYGSWIVSNSALSDFVYDRSTALMASPAA